MWWGGSPVTATPICLYLTYFFFSGWKCGQGMWPQWTSMREVFSSAAMLHIVCCGPRLFLSSCESLSWCELQNTVVQVAILHRQAEEGLYLTLNWQTSTLIYYTSLWTLPILKNYNRKCTTPIDWDSREFLHKRMENPKPYFTLPHSCCTKGI
jgi:hypothetical protein